MIFDGTFKKLLLAPIVKSAEITSDLTELPFYRATLLTHDFVVSGLMIRHTRILVVPDKDMSPELIRIVAEDCQWSSSSVVCVLIQ